MLPDSRFVYSDINFVLLGEIVQRVSGKTLPEYTREKIFNPLGMSETMYLPPRSLDQRIAPTESQRVGQLLFAESSTILRLVSWAGLRDMPACSSTAADLSKFAEMLLGMGSETAFAFSAR